jgi:large subunit ribosomal protein L2
VLETYRNRLRKFQLSESKTGKFTNLVAKVVRLEYAPRRTAQLALIVGQNNQIPSAKTSGSSGNYEYIIRPRGLKKDSYVYFGISTERTASSTIGTSRPLTLFPTGTVLHNVELTAGKGGKIARAAGTFTRLLAKSPSFTTLRLPSKEIRLVHSYCHATLGEVSNLLDQNKVMGKAGRNRWIGRRPKVRGSAMNPNDHPHGGGEGRCPVGRKNPVTPWGKPALGPKTRKANKRSNDLILRTRLSK